MMCNDDGDDDDGDDLAMRELQKYFFTSSFEFSDTARIASASYIPCAA